MNKRNYQMDLLAFFGIIFVVLGHIYSSNEYSIFTFYGLFPYYSFHLAIFMFLTGYFYSDTQAFSSLLKKKVKRLVVPYYVVNGIFLLIQTVLYKYGYTIGNSFSFCYLFFSPFTRFQPLTFSIASWYLIALFFAEILYYWQRCLIKLIRQIQINSKFSLAPIVIEICNLLFIFIFGVLLQRQFRIDPSNQTFGIIIRSFIMTYYIQIGYIYRNYLELIDNCSNTLYFLSILSIQILIFIISGNKSINFGLYGLDTNDIYSGLQFYCTGITGVAMWLRISRIISKLPESGIVRYIASHTKEIMLYHLFCIFILNTIFFSLWKNGKALRWIGGFNISQYKSSIYYACIDSKKLIIIYTLFSICGSLLITKIIEKVKTQFRKLFVDPQ